MKGTTVWNERLAKRKAIRVVDALALLSSRHRQGRVLRVPLIDSIGARLAADIRAPHPLPPFCRSGMDGYAVRSEDLANAGTGNPVRLEVAEEIPCGALPAKPLKSGRASRIMTGAQLPDGADAVVMLEMADVYVADGQFYVEIKRAVPARTNVTLTGDEVRQGERLLREGVRIGAGEIALLAAFGYAEVPVYASPVVAILSIGTELLRASEPLQPGKIRNSNGPMLAALVAEAGGTPVIAETIPDEAGLVAERVGQLMKECDFVLTTGGVSVGDQDVMADFVRRWDGDLLFDKLAMRPGSPTTAGHKDGKLLFALSGNPGACYVGFQLLARPALLAFQGCRTPDLPSIQATLAADFPKVNAYERYVRAHWHAQEGEVFAEPVGTDKSSVTVSIRDSNGLIAVPAGSKGLRAGDKVRLLVTGHLASDRPEILR